jgi:hypothetical protein
MGTLRARYERVLHGIPEADERLDFEDDGRSLRSRREESPESRREESSESRRKESPESRREESSESRRKESPEVIEGGASRRGSGSKRGIRRSVESASRRAERRWRSQILSDATATV